MTAQSGRIIDQLIRKHVHPVLKGRGFLRKGRTWNRPRERFRDVIDVQASRWNEDSSGSFTINLGVYVQTADVAFLALRDAETPAFVKVTDCSVRTRIGALMDNQAKGDRRDHWWDFDEATDLVLLGQEVAGALATRAVPFLEQFDSLESVLGFLLDHEGHTLQLPLERIHAAAILAELGDRARARELLLEAYEVEAWRDNAASAARHLGIGLESPS